MVNTKNITVFPETSVFVWLWFDMSTNSLEIWEYITALLEIPYFFIETECYDSDEEHVNTQMVF